MPTRTRPSAQTAAAIRVFREQRFAAGTYCPRCGSTKTQPWGAFSGRRRYRCANCRRTFSDLTGTHIAYRKRPELWQAHLETLYREVTLRQEARLLGLSLRTVFRWRRITLAMFQQRHNTMLEGLIEARVQGHRLNQKGTAGADSRGRRASLLLLVDAQDTAHAAVAFRCPPQLDDLEEISAAVVSNSVVVGERGRHGVLARWARSVGCRYVCGADVGRWLESTAELGRALKGWLVRFRGVATKYLEEYFYWFVELVSTIAVNTTDGLKEQSSGP